MEAPDRMYNRKNKYRKEKDKKLLFIDISARLPYGLKLKIWLSDGTTEEGTLDIKHNYADVLLDFFYYNKIKDCKPYLRPMKSMTEEEKSYIKNRWGVNEFGDIEIGDNCNLVDLSDIRDFIDWLNKNMFDYRGLIPKGLALPAKEGMYMED